jgi:hypothetical protein
LLKPLHEHITSVLRKIFFGEGQVRRIDRRTDRLTDKWKNDLLIIKNKINTFISDGFTKIDPTKIYKNVNDTYYDTFQSPASFVEYFCEIRFLCDEFEKYVYRHKTV